MALRKFKLIGTPSLDGAADETITGSWTFSGPLFAVTADSFTFSGTLFDCQSPSQFTQMSSARTVITYSASMTPNPVLGNVFDITATNGTAFTINAPSAGGQVGQQITITIHNTSGGALGAATWNAAYKLATWTQPATGFNRSITFQYSGVSWFEIARTTADVPN